MCRFRAVKLIEVSLKVVVLYLDFTYALSWSLVVYHVIYTDKIEVRFSLKFYIALNHIQLFFLYR